MPRDKSVSHARIMEAAKAEFLEFGFMDGSMRRIAANAGITAPALYKHFPSKGDMFAGLVDPAIEGYLALYHQVENEYDEELKNMDKDNLWASQKGTVRGMAYIYDHFDEFKLIICRSQGTKYEGFTHMVADLEEKVTQRYMKDLARSGMKVKKVNKKEFHLLVTANVEAMFQPVIHDFSRKEAMHFAETMETFYMPAWKVLFGIE